MTLAFCRGGARMKFRMWKNISHMKGEMCELWYRKLFRLSFSFYSFAFSHRSYEYESQAHKWCVLRTVETNMRAWLTLISFELKLTCTFQFFFTFIVSIFIFLFFRVVLIVVVVELLEKSEFKFNVDPLSFSVKGTETCTASLSLI